MVFITNFNNSRDLSDIKAMFDDYKGTNLDLLLEDFQKGMTRWSVPKNTLPGDTIVFMCAKEARHNLGMATSHIPSSYGAEFVSFVDEQKKLYKKYSGHIMGYGVVITKPEGEGVWLMSDVDQLYQFETPIYIDEFRSFISISKTNSVTYITDEQWERLKWVIHQYNTEVFTDAVMPDAYTLEQEYEDAVKNALKKTEAQLRKEAVKKSNQAVASSVLTQVYHRDPIIAAYVKLRAKGYCQLCGKKAPFTDQSGNPYLECHHIEWLSRGGTDSVDNCVALCPNCHRKMHILNDISDINVLKKSCQS